MSVSVCGIGATQMGRRLFGINLSIDAFRNMGWSVQSAVQGVFALMAVCCMLSYLWFLHLGDGRPTI